MTEIIEYQINVREQAAVAAMDKVTAGLERTVNSEKRAAAGAEDLAKKQQQLTDKSNQVAGAAARVGSVLNSVGAVTGKLDGTLGSLVQAVGRGTLAFNSMSAVLGGPIGIAIGVATAGLAVYSAYMDEAEQQAKELESATKSLQTTTLKFGETLADSVAARAGVLSGFRAKLMGERGELEKQTAAELGDREREIQSRLADTLLTSKGDIAELKRQLADVQEVKAATDLLAPGQTLARTKGGDLPKTGRTEEMKDPRETTRELQNKDRIAALNESERVAQERQRMLDRFAESGGEDAIKRAGDKAERQASRDFEAEADKRASDDRRELLQQEHAEWERLDQQVMDRHQMMRDTGQQAFAAIGAASLTAAAQAAASGKNMLKAVGAALGGVLIADGVKNEMAGIGRALFSYGLDPTSEALIAIGLAEITAGIGFGAASSGGGGASKGGGGGPRKAAFTDARTGQPVYDDGLGPASPTLVAPSRSTGSQQTNVYNFNSTFALRPEDAIQMKKTAEQGARQGYT